MSSYHEVEEPQSFEVFDVIQRMVCMGVWEFIFKENLAILEMVYQLHV